MKQQKSRDLIGKLLSKSELETVETEEQMLHLVLDKTIAENTNDADDKKRTMGERISDKVAEVAGSWTFIISFIVILAIWIIINAVALATPVDPYPFILLNLMLSCVAALQAPIIMMSQNRQDAKDRLRSENDYKVNLKAEIILEDLHKKIDSLLLNQIEIKKRLDKIEKVEKEK